MFDWFRRKASATLSAIVAPYSGGVWPSRDMQKLTKEGYEQNVIVFRCIEEVAKSVASVPVRIVDSVDEEVSPKDPLYALINRPNPRYSRATFVKELITQLLITGNLYAERVRPSDNRPPMEMWSLRSDRMKILVGSAGVSGYEYNANGVTTSWEVDPVSGRSDVLHLRTVNPRDDFYGLSPIEIAAANIDQHNEGDKWNYTLLRKGGAVSGILTAEGNLDDETFERVKQMIKETMSGSGNAGGIPLFEGGIKFQETALNPQSMAWLDNKDMTARFICQAFGVPPHLLGMAQGSTFSNVQEARIYFYDTTVVPITNWLWEELSAWLGEDFEGYRIVPDYDEVPALESRRSQRWDRIQSSDFLTINEKRELLGFPPIENGDDVYIGANMLPLGSPIDGAEEASKDMEPEEYERWLRSQGVTPLKAKALTRLAYAE